MDKPRKTSLEPVNTKMRAVILVKIPGQDPFEIIIGNV